MIENDECISNKAFAYITWPCCHMDKIHDCMRELVDHDRAAFVEVAAKLVVVIAVDDNETALVDNSIRSDCVNHPVRKKNK